MIVQIRVFGNHGALVQTLRPKVGSFFLATWEGLFMNTKAEITAPESGSDRTGRSAFVGVSSLLASTCCLGLCSGLLSV